MCPESCETVNHTVSIESHANYIDHQLDQILHQGQYAIISTIQHTHTQYPNNINTPDNNSLR